MAEATTQQQVPAAAEQSFPEKFQRAVGKVSVNYAFGVPGTVVILLCTIGLGYVIREDNCDFVQSPECVVRYHPELFDCDVSTSAYSRPADFLGLYLTRENGRLF